MLTCPSSCIALNYLFILLVKEKNSDQRAFRYNQVYFIEYFFIVFILNNYLIEPGTIVGINLKNTKLVLIFTECGCEHSQIASFGVTADTNHSRCSLRLKIQVICGT